MLAQELVRVAGGGDRELEVRERLLGRLAEADAVAPLGDDEIHDRRRPLAAVDGADDRGIREPERGHQRVGLLAVAPRLVRPERPDEGLQVVERGDALPALARVGRASGDGEPERDRAGMGDDDVEHRWLGDDRQVAGGAGADRRERPLAAVLLRRHERDDQLAGERAQLPRRCRAPAPPPGSRPRRPSCRWRRARTAGRRGSRRPTGPRSTSRGRPPARRRRVRSARSVARRAGRRGRGPRSATRAGPPRRATPGRRGCRRDRGGRPRPRGPPPRAGPRASPPGRPRSPVALGTRTSAWSSAASAAASTASAAARAPAPSVRRLTRGAPGGSGRSRRRTRSRPPRGAAPRAPPRPRPRAARG